MKIKMKMKMKMKIKMAMKMKMKIKNKMKMKMGMKLQEGKKWDEKVMRVTHLLTLVVTEREEGSYFN